MGQNGKECCLSAVIGIAIEVVKEMATHCDMREKEDKCQHANEWLHVRGYYARF
jgi:hypothetical protein